MDREQFQAVIRENRNMIYKICISYCSDPELRKDMEQDILLQIWKSFEKFDGRVKISTWIYRIALNTAISFNRNEKKHKDHRASMDDQIISLPAAESYAPDDSIAFLYQFIEKQNHLDKAIILLYLDDFKYNEIARIIGISETNVATKISRIKIRIKKHFETIKNS